MPAPPAASLPWRLRPAGPADVLALAALYASTARRLGPACYTPAQVEAWASVGTDLPAFAEHYRCKYGLSVVLPNDELPASNA